ncbi:MAG: hypothetical protein U0670_02330 [Anaerolineae bacterium]
MDNIQPKGGLGTAFFGALFGVIVLAFIQIISAVVSGNDVRVIPTLVFDSHPLKFIGDYLGYFFTTLPGLIFLVVTILCYIAATYYVQKSVAPPGKTDVEEHDTSGTMRRWLIGLNSGMNFILAYNIYRVWFGDTVGLVIAIGLFALGFLATFKGVSKNLAYQGIIGWLCWGAPMSWVIFLLGFLLFVLNLIGGLVGLVGVDVFKLGGDDSKSSTAHATVKGKILTADWATGTFFLIGGIVGNLNPEETAFNMGTFGFIHSKDDHDDRKHEAGHNLNLFVYGWINHLIGAVDENIVGYGSRSISDRMAESHHTPSSDPTLEVWE